MTDQIRLLLWLFAFVAAMIAMIWMDERPKARFSLRSFLIAMAFATFVMALVASCSRF